MCDASGNGANDFVSTTKWLDLLNKYQISFCCWNLANKDESSSVFKASSTALSDWMISMNPDGGSVTTSAECHRNSHISFLYNNSSS